MFVSKTDKRKGRGDLYLSAIVPTIRYGLDKERDFLRSAAREVGEIRQ